MIVYSDNYQELYHHGVKGQKWGVRRYQNPDGSYKAGAEGRYNNTVNVFKKKRNRTGEDWNVDDDDETIRKAEKNRKVNQGKLDSERYRQLRKEINDNPKLKKMYDLAIDQKKNYKKYGDYPAEYAKTTRKMGKEFSKGHEKLLVESFSGNKMAKYEDTVSAYLEKMVFLDTYGNHDPYLKYPK